MICVGSVKKKYNFFEKSVDKMDVFGIIKKSLCVTHGILAQLGEHLPYKQRVTGSSPVGPIELFNCEKFIYMSRQFRLGSLDGGIAQLARAHGSYPWCRGFESLSRYYRPPKVTSEVFCIS